MNPVVLFARRDLPQHGIRKGDRIVFNPDRSPYPSICRPLPNTAAIIGAFEAGDLIRPSAKVTPEDLRRACGTSDGRPRLRLVGGSAVERVVSNGSR